MNGKARPSKRVAFIAYVKPKHSLFFYLFNLKSYDCLRLARKIATKLLHYNRPKLQNRLIVTVEYSRHKTVVNFGYPYKNKEVRRHFSSPIDHNTVKNAYQVRFVLLSKVDKIAEKNS